MPAVLQIRVFLYPRSGKFPTEAALLELNPDNTIRLTKVNETSGSRKDVVFDESLADIQIWGAGTSLTFGTNSEKWRVDFSPYNAGQRVITAEQANREVFKPSDATTWAAKLKELGYPTRYRSVPNLRAIAIILALVGVAIIVAILLATLPHSTLG
ncbi:MAG: hypothetical protein QOH69_3237 [Actinomycetota bacterium]|jgi:hypothetical protein|nr:hypothetical protein [Actinomycetota bacterium]